MGKKAFRHFPESFFDSQFPKVTEIDAFISNASLQKGAEQLSVRAEEIGTSVEGRSIRALRISRSKTLNSNNDDDDECDGNADLELLVVAGLHSREWVTIGGVLCALDELVNSARNSHIGSLRDQIRSGKVVLRTVIVANPDGYSYTRTKYRHWRKNRNDPAVDLNRNFGVDKVSWGFGTLSTSSELYQGPRPFSEPESEALRTFVSAATARAKRCGRSVALLDVHCCARVVYPPFMYRKMSDEALKRIENIGINVAQGALHASTSEVQNRFRTAARPHLYTYKTREKTFSKSNTGVFIDWAFGENGVDAAYMLEVRGAASPASFKALFRNEKSDQCPVGREIVGAINALAQSFEAVSQRPISPPQASSPNVWSRNASSMLFTSRAESNLSLLAFASRSNVTDKIIAPSPRIGATMFETFRDLEFLQALALCAVAALLLVRRGVR